jgi:carotenoid cleavage dioxygenase-like enzyme
MLGRYSNPQDVMSGKATAMYTQDKSLPGRFGVLPRLANSDKEIVWIECMPSAVFHFANAFEEGDGKVRTSRPVCPFPSAEAVVDAKAALNGLALHSFIGY